MLAIGVHERHIEVFNLGAFVRTIFLEKFVFNLFFVCPNLSLNCTIKTGLLLLNEFANDAFIHFLLVDLERVLGLDQAAIHILTNPWDFSLNCLDQSGSHNLATVQV